jgi:hypothetical protein
MGMLVNNLEGIFVLAIEEIEAMCDEGLLRV